MRAAEACRSPLLRLGSRTQRVSSPDPEQEAWRRRSFVQWCTSVDLGLTRLQRTQHIQRGECPWSSILLFSSLPSLCLSTSLGSRSSTRFLPLRAPRRLNSVTRLVHELKSGMSSTRLHTLGQVTSSCARGYDLDIAKTRSKRYVGQGRSSSRRASLPEFGFTYLHPSAIARCGPTFLPRAHHGTEIFQTFDGHWFMTL